MHGMISIMGWGSVIGVLICVAATSLFTGCDADDDAPQDESGQSSDSGSIPPGPEECPREGASECFADADCVALAQSNLDGVVAPATIDPYVASSCELAQAEQWPCSYGLGNGVGAPACLCFTDPERFDLLSAQPTSCLYFGRGDACLYAPEEFPGCDPEQPETSCSTICADLETRRQQEAQAELEGEVRSATCGCGVCDGVIRLEDRCYPMYGLSPHRSYDCALDDAEILQMDRDRPDACNGF
jgi:hypothetical protein